VGSICWGKRRKSKGGNRLSLRHETLCLHGMQSPGPVYKKTEYGPSAVEGERENFQEDTSQQKRGIRGTVIKPNLIWNTE